MSLPEISKHTYWLKSLHLRREVELELFIPAGLPGNLPLSLLLLNDGQDAAALKVADTLASLYGQHRIAATAIAAVKSTGARLEEYGVAGIPDFAGRGSKAQAYSDFIIKELLPFLEKTIPQPLSGRRAIAGCSLGGLSAFDIAWNNERFFEAAGIFSGSFWWRSKDLHEGYTDDDRIMHRRIKQTKGKPRLRFWLMTGTEDETADRNRNYIIDSIDDTIDLIKELLDKGYRRREEITYYEKVGGKHDLPTWAAVFPAFLAWAFPVVKY